MISNWRTKSRRKNNSRHRLTSTHQILQFLTSLDPSMAKILTAIASASPALRTPSDRSIEKIRLNGLNKTERPRLESASWAAKMFPVSTSRHWRSVGMSAAESVSERCSRPASQMRIAIHRSAASQFIHTMPTHISCWLPRSSRTMISRRLSGTR